jgi:cytoskeletal protein RodZ
VTHDDTPTVVFGPLNMNGPADNETSGLNWRVFWITIAIGVLMISIIWALAWSLFFMDSSPAEDSNNTGDTTITGPQAPGLLDETPEPTDEPSETASASPSPSVTETSASPTPTVTKTKPAAKPTRTRTTQPDTGTGDTANGYTGKWTAAKMRLSISGDGSAIRTVLVGAKYAYVESASGKKMSGIDRMRFTFNRSNTKFYELDSRNNFKREVSLSEFIELNHKNDSFYADDPNIDDSYFQVSRNGSRLTVDNYDGESTSLRSAN